MRTLMIHLLFKGDFLHFFFVIVQTIVQTRKITNLNRLVFGFQSQTPFFQPTVIINHKGSQFEKKFNHPNL